MMNEKSFLSYAGPVLQVYREKIAGKGEDAFLQCQNASGALIGCFDGCGGIGSRRYAAFCDHTGAYVSSRVAANETLLWFTEGCEKQSLAELSGQELQERLRAALQLCREQEQSSSMLKGSLTRDFPTTLCAAAAWYQKGLQVSYTGPEIPEAIFWMRRGCIR